MVRKIGCPAGCGLVGKIGWEKNCDGDEVFRVVIDFPHGPPPLPFSVVWDNKPVTITEATIHAPAGR